MPQILSSSLDVAAPSLPQHLVNECRKMPHSLFGVADRIVHALGDRIRYVENLKSWFGWDGRRWAEIPDNLAPEAVQLLLADLLPAEVKGFADGDESKRAWRFVQEVHNRGLSGAMDLVAQRKMMRVEPGSLNAMPELLNCANGTVDLRTGRLVPHAQSHFFTMLVPVSYVEGAAPPEMWLRLLNDWCDGDAGKVAFLQRWCGYCLTGRTWAAKMLFLYGPGLNGKSIFVKVLRNVIGRELASTFPSSLLMPAGRRGTQNEFGDDMKKAYAAFFGKRLMVSSEISEGSCFSDSRVKDLVSTDELTGRFLHKNEFGFRPSHKIICMGNHKPRAPEEASMESGFWRRMIFLQFPRVVENQIPEGRLFAMIEREYPAILAWMVAGAKEVLATEDLGVTEEMKKDAESYRAESDVIGAFIEDRLVYDPGYDGDKLTQIRDAFAAWSEANGGEHLLRSPGALTRKLTERRYGGHKTELVRPRVGKERDRRLKGLRVRV